MRKCVVGLLKKRDASEEEAEATDVRGKMTKLRVLRGGAWFNTVGSCRCVERKGTDPPVQSHNYGFRVVVAEGAR